MNDITNPLLVKLKQVGINLDDKLYDAGTVYVNADDVSSIATAGLSQSYSEAWVIVVMKTGIRVEVFGTVDEIAKQLGYNP